MPIPSPASVTQDESPGGAGAANPVEQAMERLYDHYFAVDDYQRRYPAPNVSTLAFLFRHGAGQAREVLDFGCGNGRYALPLLQRTGAHVTGYDISTAALEQFARRLAVAGLVDRATLLHGPLHALRPRGRYDLVLALFGVLSHVGDRAARLQALRHVRALMQPQGRLVLSVPSKWRRRPREALAAFARRLAGRAAGAQAEPGNILFSRRLGGVQHEFFYHLYSVRELVAELAEAGFEVTAREAESVLPEWAVTQWPWLGRLDAWCVRALPAWLGYGIRVCATPR